MIELCQVERALVLGGTSPYALNNMECLINKFTNGLNLNTKIQEINARKMHVLYKMH